MNNAPAKLYLYSDLAGSFGWFDTPASFRKAFPSATTAIRAAHVGIPAPAGYHKGDSELANAPVTRVPTVRDFIHALTA
jgi:hypothetical protein